jgi:hypothetical protein
MDEISKIILKASGLHFENTEQLNEILIPREQFLDQNVYNSIKVHVPELKKMFSSSALTALQKEAEKNQKWPLLNLVRQILGVYGFDMKPIRKSDGYTPDGVKKFKRFFLIQKKKIK